MIALLALAATIFDTAGGDPARFDACVRLIKADPAAAQVQADAWAAKSNALPARQCQGLAFVANARWAPAALTFEAAAREAEIEGDGRAATLWVQAGNAALAGDDAQRARAAIDHALGIAALAGPLRGEAFMDRARADVALGDLPTARYDLDRAVSFVPGDPLLWLLSATLARRQGELDRAAKDIAEALRLAPDEPAVLVESGNIALSRGDRAGATAAWTKVAQRAPASPEGRAATAALGEAAPPDGPPAR